MAVWSDWYPDLLPHLPGCPALIVDHELRRASQVFFEGSRAWKKTLDALPVSAGSELLTLSTGSSELDTVRAEKAWYDGKPIDVLTTEELGNSFSDNWHDHTGTPIALVQFEPGVVRLYPIPTEAAVTGLVVEASIKPSDSSTGLPDNLRIKFKEAISTGAKGRLMIYPNKSWSNLELGIAMGSTFDGSVSKARLDASLSFGRGAIRSRPGWC